MWLAVLKVVNEDGGEAAHHTTAHLEEGSGEGEYAMACTPAASQEIK